LSDRSGNAAPNHFVSQQFLAAHLNDRDARHEDCSVLPWPRVVPRWLEWLAIASLVLLACHFLNISWRKWPDPQIDFGRELYIPWRLSLGDVLRRDIESPFGPLSQYFNAGLFALFGPSLMVLVSANLVVYGAILFSAYWILRQGWRVVGAWAGSAIFVSVFSFSQFDIIGNYNYATPYAHEAKHGLLVCLVLSGVLLSFLCQPTLWKCALAGFLFGLSAVLKVEIILAGSAVAAATAILHWNQWSSRAALRMGLVFPVAAILPRERSRRGSRSLGCAAHYFCLADNPLHMLQSAIPAVDGVTGPGEDW
jgi:hypothetical protein